MNLYNLLDSMISKINKSVKVEAQTLTNTEKEQARNNIDILSAADTPAPRNLLDNSNFLNPVNQRKPNYYSDTGVGKSYTGSGYGIDRWRTNYSGDVVEITANGIKNTNASTSNGWHFHQILNNCNKYVGKYITCAAKITDFSGTTMRIVVSFRNSAGSEISALRTTTSTGIIVTSGIVPEGTEGMKVGIYAYTGTAAGDYVELEWIALYEGNYTTITLPKYQPKEYAVELAECQRYYQNIACNSNYSQCLAYGARTSATNARVTLVFPQEFRIAPTLIRINSNINFIIAQNGVAHTPTAIAISSTNKNRVYLNVTCTDLVNAYPVILNAAGLQGGGYQYIEFSADLGYEEDDIL